jgi:hypothetical protein
MSTFPGTADIRSFFLQFAAGGLILAGLAGSPASAGENETRLLPDTVIQALADEISGETAKRNLELLSLHHRMRASAGYLAAARHIQTQLKSYGLEDAEIITFPTGEGQMYGTQKARPQWHVEFAELWEMTEVGRRVVQEEGDETPIEVVTWTRKRRLASWDAMPLTLAQDSLSGDVAAVLVDVGAGNSEADYAGKNVAGKLVLVSSQPGAVAALAIGEYGAVGIVSYAQNQVTAWWKENDNLVRWGHLGAFSVHPTFAFMVSLKEARAFQQRMAAGETIFLHAKVEADHRPGNYHIVTATIPGADPGLAEEEIAFTCHLDHPRPGANDNASGCVAILEIARTYAKLIREGRLQRPARTLRFIWPPEIEGSIILLSQRPDLAARIKAVLHLDMVGGGPETKAVFRVDRNPASTASFISDVAESFLALANEQSLSFASGEKARWPLVAPEGGKEALLGQVRDVTLGSDHQIFAEGSFAVPFIYLHDWPDRYIHTNFDLPENVDPTKLKRSAFIAAASAWFLADLDADNVAPLLALLRRQTLTRSATLLERRSMLDGELDRLEADNLTRQHWRVERRIIRSIEGYEKLPTKALRRAFRFISSLEQATGTVGMAPEARGDAALRFGRVARPRGPMGGFGYSYLVDKLGIARTGALALPLYKGAWSEQGIYAWEALNLVDGRRNVQEIRDNLAAQFGPVPVAYVLEYLQALHEIGVLFKIE